MDTLLRLLVQAYIPTHCIFLSQKIQTKKPLIGSGGRIDLDLFQDTKTY